MLRRRKIVREFDGIIYNCKVGRNPDVVRIFLVHLTEKHNPAVVMLQEAGSYWDELNHIPGYNAIQVREAKDSDNVAALVRDDIVPKWIRIATMKTWWWGAEHHKWRAPRTILIFRAVGIRWVNLHRVSYQKHAFNRLANKEIDNWLINRFKNLWTGRTLVVGDLNNVAEDPAIRHLCAQTGLKPVTSGGIDYVLTKGKVEVTRIKRLDEAGGSDHYPEKFHVRVWK